MTEVGRVDIVLSLEDSRYYIQMSRAEARARDLDRGLSKPIAIGVSAGAAMAVMQELIQLAGQLAQAVGPGVAMSWEKGFGSVAKTTGIDKGTGAYVQMNDELLELYATMRGVSQRDIQQGASILGSLGIDNASIADTTKVVLQAKAAFDGLSIEETASLLGQATILWDEQTSAIGGADAMMRKASSSANELGNNYSATEANILRGTAAVGGYATMWGESIEGTQAMVALFETVGVMAPEAETAVRSALNAGFGEKHTFKNLDLAAQLGLADAKSVTGYEVASKVLGIDQATLRGRMEEDLWGTLVNVVTSIKSKGFSESTQTDLVEMIFGGYAGSSWLKVAGLDDTLDQMRADATREFAEATEESSSVQEEHARQTDNLTDSLGELWGALDVARIRAWEGALGPAQKHVETLAQMVRDATPAIQQYAEAIWSGDPERMSEGFTQMGDAFLSSIESMGQRAIDAITALGWDNAGMLIGEMVGKATNAAFEATFDLAGAIWDNRGGIWEAFDAAGTAFFESLQPATDRFVLGVYKAFIGIAEISAPLFAGLETGFQSVGYIGIAVWNGLIDGAIGFANGVNTVIDAVAGLADALGSIPTDVLNDPTRQNWTGTGNYYSDLEKTAGEYGPVGFPFNFGDANVQVLALDASTVHTLGLGDDIANKIGLGGYYNKMEESIQEQEAAATEKKEKAKALSEKTNIPKSTPKKETDKSDSDDSKPVDYSGLDPRTAVKYKRPSGEVIDIRVGDLTKDQQKNIVGLSEQQTTAAKESTQASKQSATATEKGTSATESNSGATASNTNALQGLGDTIRSWKVDTGAMEGYKVPMGEAPSYEKNLASHQKWIDDMKREVRIKEDIMSLDILKEGIFSGSGYDLETLAKTGATIAASPVAAPVVASAVTASAPSIAHAIATSPGTISAAKQAVDKNSMSYLTGSKYFEDYPYEITGPYGYLWGKGSLPNVNVKGDVPTAWLSEGQPNGMDWIADEILARQMVASGTSITPWFARGAQAQPDWWISAASGLSPEVDWSGAKGGTVPALSGQSASIGVSPILTNRSVWNAIYDSNGVCIAYAEPDSSLNFTPGANYLPGGKGYGNLDEPISFASDEMRVLESIEVNSRLTAIEIGKVGEGIVSVPGMPVASGGGGGGAGGQGWLSGKPEEGRFNTPDLRRQFWNAVYDNKGTCIAYVEPDPSLNFTPNPNFKGFGNMNQGYTSFGDKEIVTWDPGIEELAATREAIEVAGENTVDAIDETNAQLSKSFDLSGMSGATLGSILGGGGGGAIGMMMAIAAMGGWGGTSINGGGAWIGTGGVGYLNGRMYYGSTSGVSNPSVRGWSSGGGGGTTGAGGGWGGAASSSASTGGSGSYGGVSWGWADGGLLRLDAPTLFQMPGGGIGEAGEAGPELMAILPLNNRDRMAEILSEITPLVGARPFKDGGVLGVPRGGGLAGSYLSNTGPASITINDHRTVQASGLSTSQIKRLLREDHEELIEEIQRKFLEEKNVRTSR